MSARVAVLKGGRSLERGVSMSSGARVQDALERAGHEVVAIDVGTDLVRMLQEYAPDVVFVALHGRDGEDGTVQELLESMHLPYTGPRPAACALASDKGLAKHLMLDAGIPTPDFLVFRDTALRELGAAQTLPEIGSRLAFPVVVKPARGGSALGVKFAATPEAVPAALVAAMSYDDKVLVERFVRGRELAVSVVDGRALPIVEAIPHDDEDFYDFEARYTIGRTTFQCPAELPEPIAAQARAIAVRVFGLLGLAGAARVDLLLDDDGGLWVLEANAIPGMTATSLLPQAAEAEGTSFGELVEALLALALRD